MSRLDLHAHTTASDGQLSPIELIMLARELHLDAIAVTDHDTTEGVGEAQAAASEHMLVIPGVELSAEDEAGDVHTLGYFVNVQNRHFQSELHRFREGRFFRGREIVEKLGEMKMPLAWERIEAQANGGAIGRPHIARAMVEAGYVNSVQEAFDRYIANDGPAYVPRTRLSPEGAIAMIHRAGGAAVLAHPGLLDDFRTMVERLVPAGLDGIEVVYPTHSTEVEIQVRMLAERYDLVMTGGSDFHGLNIPNKAMLGSVNPPEEAVEALRARAARYAAQQQD